MNFAQTSLIRYFWVLPVIYLFATIFLLRSQVIYVYLVAGVLVVLTIVAQYYARKQAKPDIRLARWLATLAAIGISASIILSIEKIELLTEPNHVASCSLSPIVACSPVIASPQASAFGLPNSFIGIFAYTAVFTAAMTLAAGAIKLKRVWWRTLLAGVVFGAGFASWLFYQGVFEIGKLCLYCMLVWLVTFAMLWLTTAYCIEKKHISFGAKLNKLLSHKAELVAITYVIIFVLLFQRWADYWVSLL